MSSKKLTGNKCAASAHISPSGKVNVRNLRQSREIRKYRRVHSISKSDWNFRVAEAGFENDTGISGDELSLYDCNQIAMGRSIFSSAYDI